MRMRIYVVLRPHLTIAIQSLKSLSSIGVYLAYNSTVNKEQI